MRNISHICANACLDKTIIGYPVPTPGNKKINNRHIVFEPDNGLAYNNFTKAHRSSLIPLKVQGNQLISPFELLSHPHPYSYIASVSTTTSTLPDAKPLNRISTVSVHQILIG
jgi:hypothetical protein